MRIIIYKKNVIMEKLKYVTKNQVLKFIESHNSHNIKNDVLNILDDLSKYKDENKFQLKFYNRVLNNL